MSDPAVPGDQAAKFGSQADFARAVEASNALYGAPVREEITL